MRKLSLNQCRSYLVDRDEDSNDRNLPLWFPFYMRTLGTSTMIKIRIICQILIQICQNSKYRGRGDIAVGNGVYPFINTYVEYWFLIDTPKNIMIF